MFEDASLVFTIVVVYVAMIVAALWFAMILWTFRDMRSRSRDTLARLLVAVMVAILNLPGLLIYVFLRPRETLSEAYERSLEEEALLQEIEEKPTCPGCGQRVENHWQVCPSCHTRLKKLCTTCRTPLELSWQLCPVCATQQGGYAADDDLISVHHDHRASISSQTRQPDAIEFVDGDEY